MCFRETNKIHTYTNITEMRKYFRVLLYSIMIKTDRKTFLVALENI